MIKWHQYDIQYGWGCKSFQTPSHIHLIHTRCLSNFCCYGLPCGCSSTVLPPQAQGFPRFERSGWNPSRCRWANNATMIWLSLCKLSNCIPHLCHRVHIQGVWATSIVVDGHMDAHSHCFPHKHFLRLGRGGWNHDPVTWMCANDANTLWLRLYNLSNCIPLPCHTYKRCLSTFYCGRWIYGCTLTLFPTNVSPDLRELAEILEGVGEQISSHWSLVQCHYAMVET